MVNIFAEKIEVLKPVMPSLTFTQGNKKDTQAFAIVQGGSLNDCVLYANTEVGVERGERPLNRDASARAKIQLPPDSMFKIIPNPDPNKRDVYYICGASGSGKSYMAKTLAESYAKLFPERPIYLISKLNADQTLDNMTIGKPRRVNVDTLVDNPITDLNEFNAEDGCMVIFDDYDTFQKPALDVVKQLIDDIASMGRHKKITMCCLTHRLTNYSKTRLLLNETTKFIVYPQSTAYHQLRYLLTTYCGLTPDQVK